MRSRVLGDTTPERPLSTLLAVWKLTPERAATSRSDTYTAGLPTKANVRLTLIQSTGIVKTVGAYDFSGGRAGSPRPRADRRRRDPAPRRRSYRSRRRGRPTPASAGRSGPGRRRR